MDPQVMLPHSLALLAYCCGKAAAPLVIRRDDDVEARAPAPVLPPARRLLDPRSRRPRHQSPRGHGDGSPRAAFGEINDLRLNESRLLSANIGGMTARCRVWIGFGDGCGTTTLNPRNGFDRTSTSLTTAYVHLICILFFLTK